jgi:hypothetical protein
MSIRKLRAGRVPNVTASTWVGENGTLFYDESTGQFKIADGYTPGGHYVSLVVASNVQVGGIKAGPGANVGSDGTLTIDTTGLPLSVADFSFTGGNLSVVNSNENMNLITNGTGNVNIIGNIQLFSTSGGNYLYPNTPLFTAQKTGNVIVNGNLVTNGNSFATGTFTFVGSTIHYGNLTINGNTVNNGSTVNNGILYQNGNLKATGQSTHIVANIATTATAGFLITGNSQGLFQAPINTGVGLHISGSDDGNTVSRLYLDSVAQYAAIIGRRFNGNIASPTQVLANQDIARFAGTPYTSGGWPTIGPARIAFTASEDISSTNQGGRIEFWATANGSVASTSIQRIAVVDPAQGIAATQFNTAGSVNAGNINVASSGTVTTPKVIINDGGLRSVTGGTSLTVDFSADSIIYWNTPSNTPASITLSNYKAGAQTKVIIRVGGTSRDINYGVAAGDNSTTGATSFNGSGVGSTSIANQAFVLDYTCVDNTAANCYVQVSWQ